MSEDNDSERVAFWKKNFLGDTYRGLDAAAEEEDPSHPQDFTKEGLDAKEVVLCLSKSIVSLVSSVDGKPLFGCTGTVVNHVGSETWILTSATLVRKPGTDHDAYKADEVKIEVLLDNKRSINGRLAMCNLQYNIAVVTIELQFGLPIVALNDPPEYYSILGRPVVAVGRDSKSQVLLVRHGNMIRKRSKLDCSELLLCTCPVSKTFIGGLVMDFERRIIGISFFGEDTTPVMPIEIVSRCLKHFKKFRTLKLPCLCIRGHAVHSLELRSLEILCLNFPELSCGIGIVVDQVHERVALVAVVVMVGRTEADILEIEDAGLISGESPENFGGIEAGDIICSIDGVVLHSLAQLTAMLLDKFFAMKSEKTMVLQAVMRRPRDNSKFVAMLNIWENSSVECSNSFSNRWPLL
ncbi:hypothetical protein SEVIR_5G050300v4 [Setaria viridis]|uniref:PDZ domain-containing protein n=1 Tax=Setaria viridis TaxID=4556 RepID=A0A4U6UF10_SETVI|nr:hypothetical protein SEVIR_5G050300v2 [Setaria viridis]TKW12673.1 hypothetical protein SEVIR_5G050300v2 [Setaria viridis]